MARIETYIEPNTVRNMTRRQLVNCLPMKANRPLMMLSRAPPPAMATAGVGGSPTDSADPTLNPRVFVSIVKFIF